MIRALVLLLIGLAACAPAPNDDDLDVLVFTPDAGLEQVTRVAAERWAKATGRDVRVGPGGMPVRGKPHVFSSADSKTRATEKFEGASEVCGHTRAKMGREGSADIWIATLPTPVCPDLGTVITHELGHALRLKPGHVEAGLMGVTAPAYSCLDAESVALICEEMTCPVMTPQCD